jgi:hypothetical protein
MARNQPQPWRLVCWTFREMRAVDAHLRRFTRGTNAPPFNLQANAVRQTSSRSDETLRRLPISGKSSWHRLRL